MNSNLNIRNKLLIPVLILTILMGGFIIMRLWFPIEYATQNWPPVNADIGGQEVTYLLQTKRTPNADRVQVRQLDGYECRLECKPESGEFSPDFVRFMSERATKEPPPAIHFKNRQGYMVHKPVPIRFKPEESGGKVISYIGEGNVILSPHAGNAEVWSIDWTGQDNPPQ